MKHRARVAISGLILIDDNFAREDTINLDLVVFDEHLKNTGAEDAAIEKYSLHHVVKIDLVEHPVNKLSQKLGFALHAEVAATCQEDRAWSRFGNLGRDCIAARGDDVKGNAVIVEKRACLVACRV